MTESICDYSVCIQLLPYTVHFSEGCMYCLTCVNLRVPSLPPLREMVVLKERHTLTVAPSIFDFCCAICFEMLAFFRPVKNCEQCSVARSQGVVIRQKVINQEVSAVLPLAPMAPPMRPNRRRRRR